VIFEPLAKDRINGISQRGTSDAGRIDYQYQKRKLLAYFLVTGFFCAAV